MTVGPAGEPLVIGPIVVPLGTIVLTLLLRRWPRLQRLASLGGGLGYGLVVGLLVWASVMGPDAPGGMAYHVGGWSAPFGISLVVDGLSAFMLAMTAIVSLSSIAFSIVSIDPRNQRVFYHPLFHLLLLGVTGAFLTGDLFNLFVWFEVMLLSSFVFVAFYGEARHTAAAFRYLVLNVVGSAFMLLGIGGLYAVTGTLNMADMARRVGAPAQYGIQIGPLLGLSAMLFAVFALKAGLVPFQFWVPAAYRSAPLPIVAMLAGSTKKVGIYAVIRLYFTVFAGAPVSGRLPGMASSPLAFLAPLLFGMGLASIAVGGVGAVSRDTIRELLAYSSIGQVGFIAIPIAIAASTQSASLRRLGILAAVVYAFHHALAKGLLFLCAGSIRYSTGTSDIGELGGLGRRSPAFAGVFLVGGLSLVGIPPLTGFFGKFLVFGSAVSHVTETVGPLAPFVLAGLLLGSVLTIVYVSRAWIGSCWGAPTADVQAAVIDRRQLAVLVGLASAIVLLGIGFEPVYRFADAAATAAIDTDGYVRLVEPSGGPAG